MKKQIASFLLLLAVGLMLLAVLSKIHVISYLVFFIIAGSFAFSFSGQELERTSGTELLEMLVSVIGTNGFFILALLMGIGSGKTSLMIISFAALGLYYWSYVRIFPKDMRRSILLKR